MPASSKNAELLHNNYVHSGKGASLPWIFEYCRRNENTKIPWNDFMSRSIFIYFFTYMF